MEATMRKFGYNKGALSKAIEETIEKWLTELRMLNLK